jgi:integrase
LKGEALEASVGQSLEISELTSDLITNYQRFLLSKNVCLNTVSYYMRILRAVYNKAVKSGIIEYRDLFSDVYTGIAKTEKRAVSTDIIQRLKQLELQNFRGLAFSRDLFLLSFYFRGMAFVDLANLKKTDVQNGVIRYTRSKTKQDLRIRIESCAKELLSRYTCKNSDRLLPIFSSFENSERAYNSALRLQNKRLSKLSKMLNLSYSLSSYVARHSWATLAKKSGVDLTVISESLGHNSILTTQIYLDSLDQERIDDANLLVISMVG